ncbi:MAG: hypothetical protein FWB95_09430 [Treponema sp.]|nr:hypothetical protein [Treponema sp.]
MKKICKLNLVVLAMIMLFAVVFAGCGETDEVTVWTATIQYSQVQTIFGSNASITDGNVARMEYSNSSGRENRASQLIAADGQKRTMTESQISDFVVTNWEITKTQADEYSAYLVSYDHGFIASRSGDTVKVVMK